MPPDRNHPVNRAKLLKARRLDSNPLRGSIREGLIETEMRIKTQHGKLKAGVSNQANLTPR
jgi:hypothetical protein